MDVRQSVHQHPKAVMIAVGVAVAAVVAFAIAHFAGGTATEPLPGGISDKAWYTDDDGRTWFADDIDRVFPFDHNGKQAYRCSVWTCDGGKTKFVSHLERIRPAQWKARQAKGRIKPPDFLVPSMDIEVKPPLSGDGGWTDYGLPAGVAIRTPHTPPGQHGTPEAVQPR